MAEATTDPINQPKAWFCWTLRAAAVAAAGVAGYLMQLSLLNRGLPPGCGAGSGCAEVLTSRWSMVAGVPISGPALVAYLAVLLASFGITSRHAQGSQTSWFLLKTLAAVLFGAALWFLAVQAFILQAFCRWCMAEHTLGILMAGLIFFNRPKQSQEIASGDIADRKGSTGTAVGLGFAGVLLFVAMQFLFPYQPPQVHRLPPGANADTGPGPERQIAVLDGKLQVAVGNEPILGSPDAPRMLAVFYDYCCPHCRATHGYLLEGLERHPDKYAVLMLPMPLNTDCNPHWPNTEARFKDSCELAHLALAVWQVDPAAFAEFDTWLYEPTMPRSATEARAKAEELVEAAALAKALENPVIEQQIARNVEAYHQSPAERIPVIMAPGLSSIVGRPGSSDELFEMLETEWK